MRKYLIESILPTQEIHLLSGPSGAGKSRLLFAWLKKWAKGHPILGLKTTPIKTTYLAFDRSLASIHETMETEGAVPGLVVDSLRDRRPPLHTLPALYPDTQLFVLDAMFVAAPMGKTNDYGTMTNWLASLGHMCTVQNVTILATHHTAKTKEGETILNPRQRGLGSVALGGFTDCNFVLEPVKPQDPNVSKRKLWVLPRNAKEFSVSYDFLEGRLTPTFDSRLQQDDQLALDFLRLETKNHPASTVALIADLLELSVFPNEHIVRESLARLQKSGLISWDKAQGKLQVID